VSTPINLNQQRKARAKEARRLQGDENAVKFGRSKAEKLREAAQDAQAAKRLDGHKREP